MFTTLCLVCCKRMSRSARREGMILCPRNAVHIELSHPTLCTPCHRRPEADPCQGGRPPHDLAQARLRKPVYCKVPTEVGGRSDSEVVPATHPHTSAASGSKSLEAGGGSNSEAVPAARPNPSAVKRPKSPSASSKDRKGKKKARK